MDFMKKVFIGFLLLTAFNSYSWSYAKGHESDSYFSDHQKFIRVQNDSGSLKHHITLMLSNSMLTDKINNVDQGQTPTKEKKSRLKPDSLVLQTAGFVGFVAAGPGWKLTDTQELILLIGYLPKSVGGVELWQATIKYEWHPFSDINIESPNGQGSKFNPLHLGFSAIYGYHKNLFITLPSQYPSDYYPPTAFRFTFNIGTSVKTGSLTTFLEFSALDVGLDAYFHDQGFFRENYNYWGLEGIGSLAFGTKVDF